MSSSGVVTQPVPRVFSQEMGEDGILVLSLDQPGEKVNTLSKGMME